MQSAVKLRGAAALLMWNGVHGRISMAERVGGGKTGCSRDVAPPAAGRSGGLPSCTGCSASGAVVRNEQISIASGDASQRGADLE